MKKEKLGQDSAYPIQSESGIDTMLNRSLKPEGMSKRFYAACAAMQGVISNGSYSLFSTEECSKMVSKSYQIVDELLSQENK